MKTTVIRLATILWGICLVGIISPAYAETAINLEEDASTWGAYQEGNPTWVIENSQTNAPTGKALRCGLTGGDPYSNIHCYRNLPADPDARFFTLELDFYLPETSFNNQGTPSRIQALEFTMNQWQGGKRYEWALQWMNVGLNGPQWRYWDPHQNERWVATTIQQALTVNQWHHLQMEGEIRSDQVYYRYFIIDGARHELNMSVAPASTSGDPDRLAVAVQADGNYAQDPYDLLIDKVNFHHHPKLSILLPLYKYPSHWNANSYIWDDVAAAQSKVDITAIINPANGPGASGTPNSDYQTGMQALRTAGVTMLGYVPTCWGNSQPQTDCYNTRSVADMKRDIKAYADNFGVQGIFFDEAATASMQLSFYQELSTYARSLGLPLIVLNPGITPDASYVSNDAVAHSAVTFESSYAEWLQAIKPDDWSQTTVARQSALLVYDVPADALQSVVDQALQWNYGYLYFTDDGNDGNPWDSLPTYWNTLIDYLANPQPNLNNTFSNQTDVQPNTLRESNTIKLSGLSAATALTVTGGEYRINGGRYTKAKGTVKNGDTLQVRHVASKKSKTTVTTTLRVGKQSHIFKSTTLVIDSTPDAFSFTALTGVARNTPVESESITLSGINTPVSVSISSGEYRINGGAYTKAKGTVNVGDTLQVRHLSSKSAKKTVTTTLTVGTTKAPFKSTTQ
jgi:ribosomal 50S subunit-recycling heat shock protein